MVKGFWIELTFKLQLLFKAQKLIQMIADRWVEIFFWVISIFNNWNILISWCLRERIWETLIWHGWYGGWDMIVRHFWRNLKWFRCLIVYSFECLFSMIILIRTGISECAIFLKLLLYFYWYESITLLFFFLFFFMKWSFPIVLDNF